MRQFSETQGRRVIARLAVIGAMSAAIAGCSSDASRMAGGPEFPFGGFTQPAAPEVTGSLGAAPAPQAGLAPIPAAPAAYGPAGGQQPLYGAPGYAANGYAEPNYQASAPRGPAYGAPGGQVASNYVAPNYVAPNYSAPGYVAPAGAGVPAGRAVAGSSHVVEAGETLNSVAKRYNVSPAALAAANNIAPGHTVRTGQSLVVPPSAGAPAPAQQPTFASAPVPPAPPAAPAMAAAKPVPPPAKPATVVASAAPTPAVTRAAAPAPAAAEPKVETAAKVSAAPEVEDAPRTGASGPQFRAPVRGRVISGFGPKPGGARNDGVNFAVPAGTAVRAAEDGVVAYSGNELKGYGNLVLIKHADGYVTAYAHNGELDVKRGDSVRRGQIIAKAGQSGDVQSPQLHFEIRKGSTAVDPSRYVAGL